MLVCTVGNFLVATAIGFVAGAAVVVGVMVYLSRKS